jgi:hypothetical protein
MHSVDPIERFLTQLAASEAGGPLPFAGVVWRRAELRRRLALEERAMRPVRIAERIACALGAVAAALLGGQVAAAAGALHFFIR